MALRYLFGPVDRSFSEQQLAAARNDGECRSFGHENGVDCRIGVDTTWESFGTLLDGHSPDLLVWWMAGGSLPEFLLNAPLPIVGLPMDWQVNWHARRWAATLCDLVLCDSLGAEKLRNDGVSQVLNVDLFGSSFGNMAQGEEFDERDIDVLCLLSPSTKSWPREMSWLRSLAQLSDRYRVSVCREPEPDARVQLFRKSKIVLQPTAKWLTAQRALESAASGALVFFPAGRSQFSEIFRSEHNCIMYLAADLESLLRQYLDDDVKRPEIAKRGRQSAVERTFSHLWAVAAELIEQEWPTILERFRARQTPASRIRNAIRSRVCDQMDAQDCSPIMEQVARELVHSSQDAELRHSLGHVTYCAASKGNLVAAIGAFEQAIACDPQHVVAGLSLVECLLAQGRKEDATKLAHSTLRKLTASTPLPTTVLNASRIPAAFHYYGAAWEECGIEVAGHPARQELAKRALLRSRLHLLLGEMTGDLLHYHESALADPRDPVSRAALGCALARSGRLVEAFPHLAAAVNANPLDRPACRALFGLFGDLGDHIGQRRLARDLRRLSRIAPELFAAESWFANAAPVGDELASVLIVCHNGRAVTEACIESVLKNTRAPFELIVVDNGSSDDTHPYLANLSNRQCAATRFEIVRNADNCGYPAAMNQALALAHGDYVVLLNNDTLVPPDWLDGLIPWLLMDWPKVGMVGPMTNAAPPPQCVAIPYSSPHSGLASFAAIQRKKNSGQGLDVDRLSGFCMVVRRDVLNQVGPLDEQFGIGFFDDDDLVLRVRAAGYRVLIAQDVFVHHHGSHTFGALGVDCVQLLEQNLALFRNKWGADRAARYRLPVASTVPQQPQSSPCLEGCRDGISICLIVRNEEENLRECLRDWKDLFSQAVVVDTGSTDRTREIAKDLGAEVYEFPWCDNFAAARNISLEQARCRWVFWMDADDRLDDVNRAKLRDLFASLPNENLAYSMKCVCVPDQAGASATAVDHIRLFRNDPRIRWKYRVHEQILMAVRATGAEVRWADVEIQHVGYVDPALRRRKLERDLRLLELELQEQPQDAFTLFNLGSVHQELKNYAESLPLLRRSLERSNPADSIVRKLYAMIAVNHRKLNQLEEALAACCHGREHYPDDVELLFMEGLLHRDAKRFQEAEKCWLRLLDAWEGSHFASVDMGLRGYKTRHNLAVLYMDQGRLAEAEAQWRAALQNEPHFAPALLGLGELFLKRQRWTEFDDIVRCLQGESDTPSIESAALRARGYMERKEFAAARWTLSEAIERFPRDLGLRIAMSHVLLKEGVDSNAASAALRQVLAIDPENREAQHNLRVLQGCQTNGSPGVPPPA